MSNLNRRVEKLEKQAGVGDSDSPVIRYICKAADGAAGAEVARKKAVAEWEAENGPLEGREPQYIERSIVSPPPKEADQKPGTDIGSAPGPDAMQEPKTNVTPFLARRSGGAAAGGVKMARKKLKPGNAEIGREMRSRGC
jgi:hypothetical protein